MGILHNVYLTFSVKIDLHYDELNNELLKCLFHLPYNILSIKNQINLILFLVKTSPKAQDQSVWPQKSSFLKSLHKKSLYFLDTRAGLVISGDGYVTVVA